MSSGGRCWSAGRGARAAGGGRCARRGPRRPGRPISSVQRSRLCASAAITVQAALAEKWPDGKCASAWSLRSRMASSTTACWRCSASTIASARCGWSTNAEVLPVGQQLALRRRACGRGARPGAGRRDGLGDLRDRSSAGSRPASAKRPRRSARSPLGRAVAGARRSSTASQPGRAARRPWSTRTPSRRAAASARCAPARVDARDQLVAEAQHPARGVRRALAQADVQDLAGVRAGGEQRVVAALARVAERRRPAWRGRRPRRRSCRRRRPGAPRPARRRPSTRASAPRRARGRAGGHART